MTAAEKPSNAQQVESNLFPGSATQEAARHRLLLLLGILVGFGLRIFRLGGESLWYDETVSVFLAQRSVPELIAHTARDIHPPGYYLLLHAWQALVHPSLAHGLEFLYAWPSLFFGLLLLPLLYVLGRKLFNPQVGLLALWLAGVNPFHIWYSQEVRMYTLGAALGLLALWAVIRWWGTEGTRARLWLALYALAAGAGLYTLYYFAFLLVGINALVLLWLAWSRGSRQTAPGRNLGPWILAQAAALLLWSPWWPVFWRQITQPPVPPWRTPVGLGSVLVEALAGLLVGQTPPGGELWPWALLSGGLLLLALIRGGRAERADVPWPALSLTLVFVVPGLAIVILSALLTPLYHVRYLFTYAPVMVVVLALAVWGLGQRSRWLHEIALLGLLLISGWSLAEFWQNPAYRTDDHRTAVANLAARWRPGDAILVNAGWVYTALSVYWPEELVGPESALPPTPVTGWSGRLLDYAKNSGLPPTPLPLSWPSFLPILRTGSVDGPPSLGWGLAESDFYAMGRAETLQALATVAERHSRLWHYRLYDTVSDPQGVIRSWLGQETSLRWDQPYPGRDFLRVQLFETRARPSLAPPPTPDDILFGEDLRLVEHVAPTDAPAGTFLYAQLHWQRLAGTDALPDLRMSLRLVPAEPMAATAGDAPFAQQDEAPALPTSAWQPGQERWQPLALPIPAATPPGRYWLELVVYDGATGVPLPLPEPSNSGSDPGRIVAGQRWRLGPVTVQLPSALPEIQERLATFDYIDLVGAQVAPLDASPGEALHVQLIWRPRPSPYRDAYTGILALQDASGQIRARWDGPIGGPGYPSGAWEPGYPVKERRILPLPPKLPPGQYTLTLRLERSQDGLPIPARSGWLPWPQRSSVALGAVTVRK